MWMIMPLMMKPFLIPPVDPWTILIWSKARVPWLLNPNKAYPQWTNYRWYATSFSAVPQFSWTWFKDVAQMNTSWSIRLVFNLSVSWYRYSISWSWPQIESNWRSILHQYRWWLSVAHWGSTFWNYPYDFNNHYDINVSVQPWDIFKFEYWANCIYHTWSYPWYFSHNWECSWVDFYTLTWDPSVITIL
jgi:hypothetical protein